MSRKILLLAVLTCVVSTSADAAGDRTTRWPLTHYDWQEPPDLPPRFRNHCSFDVSNARPYCSDHCGSNYQIYYCSKESFGCCRIGSGYCDWNGFLRCRP
jgi:hypothetical protein